MLKGDDETAATFIVYVSIIYDNFHFLTDF